LLLGVCWQPPNCNVTQKAKFIDCLGLPINAQLHDAPKIVLLAGDFNDPSMDKPLDFLSSHGFDQLIVSPTRNSSALD